jgi:hypothetical protein
MKKITFFFLLLVAFCFLRCSGSETYRGSWKAMDLKGNKWDILFKDHYFTIKDSIGKSVKYHYNQHSVSIENGVSTYGISLKDGRKFIIHFPNANNQGVGLLKDENGVPLYTLSKGSYLRYEDLYKL